MLDSGSVHTQLPAHVIEDIRMLWLKGASTDKGYIVFEPDVTLDKCDIIFQFVGSLGEVVDFRCSAGPFLRSPWSDGGRMVPLLQTTEGLGGSVKEAILGINFFWTAFVRLDATKTERVRGQPGPFLQFAPQRIVKGTTKWEGHQIVMYDDSPRRLQMINHNTRSLKMD